MLRALKFTGLLLVNIIVAIIGTAIVVTAVRAAIPSNTIAALVWKESILSVICAGLIGFGMWRTWRDSAAKWTWVLPTAWFVVGYMVTSGKIFGRRSSFESSRHFGASEVRDFFTFAVPLIRCMAYSVAAYISSRIYPEVQSRLPKQGM